MENKCLRRFETAGVSDFTSNFGLKFRKYTHKMNSLCYKLVLKYYYHKNIIVENRPLLDKNKCYVFSANHTFYFDIPSIIATIDRNSYLLFGATEQLKYSFDSYYLWLSGFIYVNRFDNKSRKDSIAKMNRVLNAGNSILIFPEGKYNDSENKLCQNLFSGVHTISVLNNVEVVPISVYNDSSSNNIYVNYGESLKLYNYDRDSGLQLLRDIHATMYYEQIEKYSTPFVREDINGDIHFNYMMERMDDYSNLKWKSDFCWDTELFVHKIDTVDLEDVWKNIDKVNIDVNNVNIFGDILVELERRKKYDFKRYMNENYRKKY